MTDKKQQQQGGLPKPEVDVEDDFQALERAGKKGLLGRFNTKFNDALQSGRGPERMRNPVAEMKNDPHTSADDVAIRRARNVNPARMVIPEGVIIEGSLSGGSETEINGRIEGDISVDGWLYLGPSALVSGNVRAGSCRIEGLVEGKVECSEELNLGQTGRLNADAMAGKKVLIAGQVYGNVVTPGMLQLVNGSMVQGDIRARRMVMEEGASFEGECSMRPPSRQKQSS
jgi:cytoskeletal protein CcmA (bactofilin family)